MTEELEVRQGKILVDAAKAAGVQHFVWSWVKVCYVYQQIFNWWPPSTLEHTTEPYLSHWNSKATVNDYLIASGLPRTSWATYQMNNITPIIVDNCTSTRLYTSFYTENFAADSFFPIVKVSEGKYKAKWDVHAADGLLGTYIAGETGGWVVPAFKNPQEYISETLYCCLYTSC